MGKSLLGERTLRHLLVESNQLDWPEAIELAKQIGEQIERYHTRGRCPHGAINPENIFLGDEPGVYRLGPPSAEIDASYAPPEVLHGGPEQPDASSDVYSLGVVLYEALAGNHCLPFHVQQRFTGPSGQAEWTFTPARDSRATLAHVPAAVRRVIEQATRLIPANRFPSVEQLLAALETAATTPEAARQAQQREATGQAGARWQVGLGLGLVVAILLAAIGFLLYPYVIASPAEEEMRAARAEALAASAPNLVPQLWERGEHHPAATDYAARARLYRAARDQAWKTMMRRVEDAEQEALAFQANAEPLFTRALDSRQRAEQLWSLARFGEAIRQLTEAEEFFQAAKANRRQRLADGLEDQLKAEEEQVRKHLPESKSGEFLGRIDSLRALLRRSNATLAELNSAEQQIADLRQQIASALQEAGEKAAAKQSAEAAIAASEQERANVQNLRKSFPSVAAAAERGETFLAGARGALEEDPARALALADAATNRFRAARAAAEQEVAAARQTASKLRRQAEEAAAGEWAGDDWERAQEAYQRGEAALKTGDLVASKAAFSDAARAFTRARERAIEEEQQQQAAQATATARAEAAARAARPTVPPYSPPTPNLAAVPPPAPAPPQVRRPSSTGKEAKDLGPMPPLLAQAIQTWLAEHCRALDRSMAASQGRRARCDQLVVLDRRDPGNVQVSFQLATGLVAADGIRWDQTDTRSATLDCTGASCRCIGGSGC